MSLGTPNFSMLHVEKLGVPGDEAKWHMKVKFQSAVSKRNTEAVYHLGHAVVDFQYTIKLYDSIQ